MPFDFDRNPLNLYGIWPQTPFPLELSLYGFCQMSCSYCFANLNRHANERELNPTNTTPALFRRIDRALQDEYSPLGFFLRERYPVAFSNRTDPFQRAESTYRSTEAFLACGPVLPPAHLLDDARQCPLHRMGALCSVPRPRPGGGLRFDLPA